jgi:DNA-binding NtrC family response regulator
LAVEFDDMADPRDTRLSRDVIATGLTAGLPSSRRPARQWQCRIVSGKGAGSASTIGQRPLLIGADRRCDLVLDDEAVSRRHAELHLDADGVRLRDLDSTNGTTFNGARISNVVLTSNATFCCGETTLAIEAVLAPVLPASKRQRFGGLVGHSLVMREIFATLELASASTATIVIQGESGTGKELTARAIHDHSPRAAAPFVVVDCSAASDELITSQLFGHKRGAFTGAHSDRKGAFVAASGGTLFLDELGELSAGSQARLLRALEQQEVTPLGSDTPVRVDTRVVAATHRDLLEMVTDGAFRFDLYHRLAVVLVALPALRDHIEDLPALVAAFYEGRDVSCGAIDGDNLSALQKHSWPGNVRELRNVLERAWALSGGVRPFRELRVWVGPTAPGQRAAGGDTTIDAHLPFKEAKEHWNSRFERRYLATVFEAHERNITRAAEHAGINRRHFRELLKKHGLYGED